MLGNFTYCNPTKLHSGENALDFLSDELKNYGKNVMLCYGGGSIKKNGIYDKVVEILKASEKNVFEDDGVMPNPTVDKLYEGCKIAKEKNVDLILAVGGGSVCTIQKQFQYRHTVKTTHGKSILCVWKTLTIKLSRLDAF